MRATFADRLRQGLTEGIEHARGERSLVASEIGAPSNAREPDGEATIPKNILSLAGEYFVAAELSRWGFMASITYGSAKSVDIQVTNPTNRRLVWIEAKTTQKYRGAGEANARWVVNATQLGDPVEGKPHESEEAGADFYVFVLVKPRTGERPRYFVASRQEVLADVRQSRERYNERRAARGKGPFEGRGVPGVTLQQLVDAGCENAWSKIVERLEASTIQAA